MPDIHRMSPWLVVKASCTCTVRLRTYRALLSIYVREVGGLHSVATRRASSMDKPVQWA